MKKWKELSGTEKGMLILIVVLLIGIVLRWGSVRDGIVRAFKWYDADDTEQTVPADEPPVEMTIPADTFPPEEAEVILLPGTENE